MNTLYSKVLNTGRGCIAFVDNTFFFVFFFSESVNSYAKKVVELDYLVKRMVFESYELDNKKFESLLESTDYILRCYKYRTSKGGETNLGVHPHTDSGFLTILNQKLNGLEIQLKDGEWLKVDASPNMFAVLAGDAFMVVCFSSSDFLLNVYTVMLSEKYLAITDMIN